MSHIKASDTKPELIFRKALFSSGLRYRLKNNLVGKPDIIFPKKKIAIFIDGCFWHKCPKCFIEPETNKYFWKRKINQNVKRDKKVNHELKSDGWRVIRIWEHDIKLNLHYFSDKIMMIVRGENDKCC